MIDKPAGDRYRGFISYATQDARFASWLHKQLEGYRIHSDLVRAHDLASDKLGRFFRDREELPTSGNLGQSIEAALAKSDNLILVASHASAQSRWVNEEVRQFQTLGRADRIFCVIVDGDPPTCFPTSLRDVNIEPLAADARKHADGRQFALLKLIAGLLDVGFDSLQRRETRKRHRKLTAIAGASIAGMALTTSLAVFAFLSRQTAEYERDRANLEVETLSETGNFLIGLFRGQNADQLTARDILDRAGKLIVQKEEIPLVQARMMHTIAEIHMNLGDLEQGMTLLEASLRVKREYLAEDHATIAASLMTLGNAYSRNARFDISETLIQRSLDMYRRLGQSQLVAETALNLGQLYRDWHRYQDAVPLFDEALNLLAADDQSSIRYLRALNQKASLNLEIGDYESAKAIYESARAIAADSYGEQSYVYGVLTFNLGTVAYEQGDYVYALAALQTGIELMTSESTDPKTLKTNRGLANMEFGRVYQAQGNCKTAIHHFRASIELLDSTDNTPRTRGYSSRSYLGLATCLDVQGLDEQAVDALKKAEARLQPVLPDYHPGLVEIRDAYVALSNQNSP